jgi:hypothetical protein
MIFGVRWQSKLEMQLHAILGKMIAASMPALDPSITWPAASIKLAAAKVAAPAADISNEMACADH